MAPIHNLGLLRDRSPSFESGPPTRARLTTEGGFLEAWAQGYNVGSLIVLMLIASCNYRSGIWLHKLILLELVLALWHGTFIFAEDPAYGWYLSSTATLLFMSYALHNVVSWLKIRPFLPRWGSMVFIWSLVAVQPFWVVEAWSNFEYFNSLGSDANVKMRPWESLVRDPWWIFTTWKLIDAVKKTYGFSLWALIKINRRFGVMLVCMFISIVFVFTDIVVTAIQVSTASGINPYWRFALVFKCASDTIFLDDFRTVLDDIVARKFDNANGDGANLRSVPECRRNSVADGTEFLEYRPIDELMTLNQKSHSKFRNPFSFKKNSRPFSGIHLKKEFNVASEARKSSKESYCSDHIVLMRPPPAMYSTHPSNDKYSSRTITPPNHRT